MVLWDYCLISVIFFFFKQKTAYEMRISDWSSDVCSSDLATLADSDDALFDSQVAVNLKGTFNTLREAARRLRDGGRVVNMSTSVVGMRQIGRASCRERVCQYV